MVKHNNYNSDSLHIHGFAIYKHLPAAAAAKSLQSCPTLCDPIDSSPPGFPVPGILQARVLEWGAIAFSEASPYVLPNLICSIFPPRWELVRKMRKLGVKGLDRNWWLRW